MYMNVLQGDFEENGAGALDLRFNQSVTSSFRTLLGGQFDFRRATMPNLIWSLRSVWMHECINEATTGTLVGGLAAIPGSSFLLARPNTGSDWFVGGCGVRGAFFAKHFRPFADYDVLVNTHQALHAGFGGIEYVW
jgi:hypothetical protein